MKQTPILWKNLEWVDQLLIFSSAIPYILCAFLKIADTSKIK